MNAFWTDLENRFSELHEEQRTTRGLLHAFLDGDRWDVGGGSENIKKKFEWIVEQAAARLKCPAGTNPLDFWLNLLKKESPYFKQLHGHGHRRKSELDTEYSSSIEYERHDLEGGEITLLCKASSEYCIHCDTHEQLNSGKTAIGIKPEAAQLTERDLKILAVIQRGSKGPEYCREVHNAGVRPRRDWMKEGCPGTYPAAYRDGTWRQRINDEKSKIRRKANGQTRKLS